MPDPARLIEALDLRLPLLGLYDAPDPAAFAPLVEPPEKGRACVFAFHRRLLEGRTLHLTADRFGCGGAGRYFFGVMTRSREEYLRFLVDDEGLRDSRELMAEWFDRPRKWCPRHPHVLLGRWRADRAEHLATVTFLVNPDQLGALVVGAHYHSRPSDPPPVIAPFGAGCGQLVSFERLDVAQAAVGATDLAMRRFLPRDVMAFSVTPPMLDRLCSLDDRSFLSRPFLSNLRRARGGSLAAAEG